MLRSNAIRDSAGFRFEEFTNQVQYAQLIRALNRHAVSIGHGSVDDVVEVELKRGAL